MLNLKILLSIYSRLVQFCQQKSFALPFVLVILEFKLGSALQNVNAKLY